MKLEQKIHAYLLCKVGGLQKDVNGISQTMLSKMKAGKSGMTVDKLAEVCTANGIDGNIILKSEDNEHTTTIKLFK